MNRNNVGTCALLAFLLVGCSSKPSASKVEKVITHWVQKNGNGLIRLDGVEVTNSQRQEFMGVIIYKFDYAADIFVLGDCWFGDLLGQFSASPRTLPREGMSPWQAEGIKNVGRKAYSKGQRVKVTGTVSFQKTERGWKGPDGRIY